MTSSLLMRAGLCALLIPFAISPALAQEMSATEAPKRIEAELVVEWQNENRDSDNVDIDDTNHSFLRAELAPTVHLSDGWFIDGVLVFEPFDQAESKNIGDDIWFESNGLYAEEVKLNYAQGAYAAWAGKFDPSFGTAWDYGRGIWSEDFAEDYEIAEKLGAGVSYTFETANAGNHTLSATSFFADTSFLSSSTITRRPQARLSDGGASNTEDFGSYTVSLDGENVLGVEALSYHLAYRSLGEQDEGQSAATDDESGVAAALNYAFPVSDTVQVDVLGEVVTLSDFNGVRDADVNYYSASSIFTLYEDWNITAGYTKRDTQNDGSGAEFDDHLLQLTGGYDFGNGLTAEGGWRNTDEQAVDTDIVGFLVRYTKEF